MVNLCLNNILRGFFLLICTCSCGSGYRAPAQKLPSHAIADAVKAADDEPLIDTCGDLPQNWWTLFNDEQLNFFIHKTYCNSPNLQAAHAKILRSIAVANQTRSILYPNINLGGNYTRHKFSETSLIPFAALNNLTNSLPAPLQPSTPLVPVYFSLYQTEVNLSYDFDLWGKNRNTWCAAVSEVNAKIADQAFICLQIGISVASTYFKLQVDYEQRDIAQSIVENQEELLKLMKMRQEESLQTAQDILDSEILLSQARQNLLEVQNRITIEENQLNSYLADTFEETIYQIPISEKKLPAIPLPKNVPLNLISRRPDVIAQLSLIRSAGHLIEVAKAGFYPDFNILGFFGFQTIHFRELFNYPSTFFNATPAFSLPIFQGGRLVANLQGSEVDYNLAIYKYNNLLIDAVREVLDSISVLSNSDHQLQEFTGQRKAKQEQVKLIELKLNNNIASYMDYLKSETELLKAREKESSAIGGAIQASLQLIKALGGGYEIQ